MSYSPPGVTTLVQIQNNIVQLPGGTRILSLIGTGQKTKNISGESVRQPLGYVSNPLQYDAAGIVSVNSVYDYSGPGGSQKYYPTTGTGAFGSGYWLSGNSIAWTPAANPHPDSTTPAVGQTFYVQFSGTDLVSHMSTGTQTSNYDVIIPGTGSFASIAIQGVSGTTGYAYPASGTATNPDSSGYATTNSGYVLSPSGTLLWGSVPASAYRYPAATVAPLSGTYLANYTYNKSGTDYAPTNYVDYTLVVQNYGPEANWIPVTGASGGVSYNVQTLNPITLAARLAFANGASVVSITQMSGNGTTAGDFQQPLNLLQGEVVDIIVPLTCGSGATTTDVTTVNKEEILDAVLVHCDTMSLPQNARERVAVGTLGVAEIGNATTPETYVFDAESTFNDKRMSIIAPGVCTVQIQDPTGAFQNVDVESSFLAAAYGALSCNPLSDVATPLTRQQFTGFVGLNATTPNHPNKFYLEIEKNILGGAGVCVIDTLGARIYVRQQLTTDQSSPAAGEFSVVTSTDYVSQAVRYTCNQFIGKKLIPAIVVPAVKSTILATMQVLAQDSLISAIGAITVTVDPTNPTQILATVQYVPVFPLNHIQVTFTIRTQL